MSKIRQADIYPGSISLTKGNNFAITGTVTYAQSNLTKTSYAIGTVGGMASTDPIAIKEWDTTNSPNGWSDEQDWTAYNQSFTTVIPVTTVAGGIASPTTSANASISIGDLVGIYGAGSWSTAGNLNSAKARVLGIGSQSSGLIIDGMNDSGNSISTTELFNGSIWSLGSSTVFTRIWVNGTGSQNSALIAGGSTDNSLEPVTTTEIFNGAAWSNASANLNTGVYAAGSAGSHNAGLIVGGNTTSGRSKSTELFNSSSWSVSGAMSLERMLLSAFGSQNSAMIASGRTGVDTTVSNLTELFNGSTWSKNGNLITARYGAGSMGSQNAAMIASGSTGSSTAVAFSSELFNGSTWFAGSDITTKRTFVGSAGGPNAGLVAGGCTAAVVPHLTVTELHNQTLYRKITNIENYKMSNNIGIAFDVTSTTLSVKFQGFINNINVTSSNSAITTATQWVDKWLVLPRFYPNASTTNNPSSVLVKASVEADDLLIGRAISRTQIQVFAGNIYSFDRIGRW